MNKKKRMVTVLLVALLAFTSIVLANTRNIRNWWDGSKIVGSKSDTAQSDETPDPLQQELLKELSSWMKAFDSTNVKYHVQGFLTAVDKTDTAHALIDIPYQYMKDGDKFYLRNGQTETVNTADVFVMVDHEARRMVLTKSRKAGPVELPGGNMLTFLKDEKYTLHKENKQGRTAISMVNPHHVSIKELTVQFDSTAMAVKQIYFRQADIADPLNTDLDKWVRMDIRHWDDHPDAGPMIQVKKFVRKDKEQWVTTPAFKDYELMIR